MKKEKDPGWMSDPLVGTRLNELVSQIATNLELIEGVRLRLLISSFPKGSVGFSLEIMIPPRLLVSAICSDLNTLFKTLTQVADDMTHSEARQNVKTKFGSGLSSVIFKSLLGRDEDGNDEHPGMHRSDPGEVS